MFEGRSISRRLTVWTQRRRQDEVDDIGLGRYESAKSAAILNFPMELSELRKLKAVAEHGTMSKAARALRMSQPSLTQGIQRLEARLDTTLLYRSSRGTTLTEAGRLLLAGAERVFAILNDTEASIRALDEDQTGHFTVGCHESLGAYFLPDFMSRFLLEAPAIKISLRNTTSAQVRDFVVDRTIDFGLVVNPEPHDDLVMVELFDDAVEVLSTDEATFTLSEAKLRLRAGPLIYANRVGQCQDIIDRLEGLGCMPDRRLECGDLEMVKSLARAGVGAALLPRRVAEYGTNGCFRTLHPDLPRFNDTIYLLYRADLIRTAAKIRLKDALVSYGRELKDAQRGVA